MIIENVTLTDTSGRICMASIDGVVWGGISLDVDSEISNRVKAWLAAGNASLPFVPLVHVPIVISRRRFYQALVQRSVITMLEAIAAMRTGVLPAAIQAWVDTLPAGQRFVANMVLAEHELSRKHPIMIALMAHLGIERKELWLAAGAVA